MNQGNKRANLKDALTPRELIQSKTVEQLPVKQGKLGVNAQNPPSVLDSMKIAPSKLKFLKLMLACVRQHTKGLLSLLQDLTDEK